MFLVIFRVAVCFSSPNIHSVDFTSFQPRKSQQSTFRKVFGLYLCLTSILPYFIVCPPFSSPPVQCEHCWFYLARPPCLIFFLFGGNFCEQQPVLGRLSNTVKRTIFCVNFICLLTILGWLWWYKIFKLNYLVTLRDPLQ